MFLEIIGWSGTILVVLAYYLVTAKKLSSNSRKYQVCNLLASLLMGYYAAFKMAWASFGLQIIWGAIAIYGLINIQKHKK